jgi:predicted dehydrogenase
LVKVEVEDTAVATLRFENGALGVVEVTTAARPDDFEASISILTERGTAVLGGLTANRLIVWTPDPDACETYSEEVPNAYGLGHRPLLGDVIADLSERNPHPISFQDGTRAVNLLNALYRSAEDGLPVELKDHPHSRFLGREDGARQALYLTDPD